MRRLLSIGLTLGLLAGLVAQLALPRALKAATESTDPEDELKAATVLAFLQNAKWLDAESGGPFLTVGVVGRPAISAALHRAIEGKTVNGRVVRILDLTLPADPRCCQLLYVATDHKLDIRRALTGTAAAHVLTIGEANRFLEDGGAINLFLVDGHMAFEVSMAALDQCRVAIGSKLLRYGRVRDLAGQRGPG
ncbi:MAG: YfiR family protein [Candidatus Solibacter sp.]